MPLFKLMGAGGIQDFWTALVLVACVRAVSFKRRDSTIGWGLAIIPIVSLLIVGLPEWFNYAARLLALPFFVYTVVILTKELMTARSAGPAELFGAASTYMLIGVTWGLVYWFMEYQFPGSFSFPDARPIDPEIGRGEDLHYYSFVTLVTLGYGEITPVSDIARSFAVTEAIMGNLFLTMLVARLVGLYTSRQMDERHNESPSSGVDS